MLRTWPLATFGPARTRAGLSDRFRIHDLRHTAAPVGGYPPKMLQEIMGHASITTTLDLYGHLYPGLVTFLYYGFAVAANTLSNNADRRLQVSATVSELREHDPGGRR